MTDGGRTSRTEGRRDGEEEEGEKIEGTAVKIEETSDGQRGRPGGSCPCFLAASRQVVERICASTDV